jgi:hypothetical protein
MCPLLSKSTQSRKKNKEYIIITEKEVLGCAILAKDMRKIKEVGTNMIKELCSETYFSKLHLPNSRQKKKKRQILQTSQKNLRSSFFILPSCSSFESLKISSPEINLVQFLIGNVPKLES